MKVRELESLISEVVDYADRDSEVIITVDPTNVWVQTEEGEVALVRQRVVNSMTFGEAVQAMKAGQKVCRAGWNGKGMYVVLMEGYPNGVPASKETAIKHNISPGDIVRIRPYMALMTAQGDIACWAPSGSDSLATDWEIVK